MGGCERDKLKTRRSLFSHFRHTPAEPHRAIWISTKQALITKQTTPYYMFSRPVGRSHPGSGNLTHKRDLSSSNHSNLRLYVVVSSLQVLALDGVLRRKPSISDQPALTCWPHAGLPYPIDAFLANSSHQHCSCTASLGQPTYQPESTSIGGIPSFLLITPFDHITVIRVVWPPETHPPLLPLTSPHIGSCLFLSMNGLERYNFHHPAPRSPSDMTHHI